MPGRIGRPEARHIEIGLVRIATHVLKQRGNYPLALRVVDKGWLHLNQEFSKFLRALVLMDVHRVVWRKRFLDHASREFYQC